MIGPSFERRVRLYRVGVYANDMRSGRFSEDQIISILAEQENSRLKILLADAMLDNVVLKNFWESRDDAPR